VVPSPSRSLATIGATPGFEGEGRMRVAQFVQAERRQLRRLRLALEPVREALRVNHPAELVREDEALRVLPG
jgi:hypothetical protein